MSSSPSHGMADSPERLGMFVSSITDYAIYMLTPQGRVSSWNAGAERFKGYTASEIIGQHFSRFYTDEDQAAGLPERALRLAETTGKFEAEGWRVRKDGTRFWATVVIDPIRNEHRELVGFAKITRDVTERRAAEQQLRESEQRFRLLVQGVTDYAIYMLSPDGAVTNWNAGARRIKGYDEAEAVGSHFSRFYSDEDRSAGKPAAALEAAAKAGRFEAEGVRVRKDGSRFMAHVVIDAIRDDDGRLLGFAKITRDITERVTAQEELARAKDALYQAQKMDALGKVTGGVAHDFNNLLGVVVNGLAILRRKVDLGPEVRLIDTMEQALDRGVKLVRQLLAFARQQPLERAKRDLNRVVSAFESVLRRAGPGDVSLEFSLAPAVPPALVDVTQVEAALLNLVVNAFDATPAGGRIVVSSRVEDLADQQVKSLKAGRYVAIAVADSGHGMSAQTLANAVDPFFTTKPAGKGTGLGLSQVYGMVQQSGGDLDIQSQPSIGTTITLYFPAVEDGTPLLADPEVETVLVVDDQSEVLDMTGELFRTLGFAVLSANSGERALQVLRDTPAVNLLFSDVVMPGMGGVELAEKAVAARPGLRVILTSGFAGDLRDGPAQGRLGGFPFLSKPYRLNDVIKKLRALH